MNEASGAIAAWLGQKRHRDRISAAVISMLAMGSGVSVFLLTASLVYSVLFIVCGAFARSVLGPALLSLALTGGVFWWTLRAYRDNWSLGLDPLGFWIVKDFCSIGPRLLLEGLRHLRRCADLGELNIPACAQALAYLARRNSAVSRMDLMQHCPQLAWPRLKLQLALLDGVLLLGEDADRVSLMDPFRMRLRWLLKQEEGAEPAPEPAQARSEPSPQPVSVNDPDKLSAYELLGLSPAASVVEIKTAYRKRVKECHPDRFAGMDQRARDLAEKWTKALNAAYSSLMAGRDGR